MTTVPTPQADTPAAQPPPTAAATGATRPVGPVVPVPAASVAFDLVGALRAKMAAERLSIRAAARVIGIDHPVLWQVLSHRIVPSATRAPLFAAWLGVDVALLPRTQQRGSGPSRPTPPVAPSAGKSVAAPKGRTRRGRPPAPERQGRTAAPAMVNRPLDEVLAAVRSALLPPTPPAPTAVHPIMKDQLALAVHAAPAKFRKVIFALLDVSGARIRRRPTGKPGVR